ncbi:MAG: hypothetical protein Q9168_002719 [Polycauliona sp. 1 TL-2023]
MALALRGSSWHDTQFLLLGGSTIILPNETIKSYLPKLWRRYRDSAQARGYLDFQKLGYVRGPFTQDAARVVLKALQPSAFGDGVANELQNQLDNVLADRVHLHVELPKHTMSEIFGHVADLIRMTGRHREMAYAMSEWFTRLAARCEIDALSMFSYIDALDRLGTSMTGPLRALLGQARLTSRDVRFYRQNLRRRTVRELMELLKDYDMDGRRSPRRSMIPAAPGLIRGGDLSLEELALIHRENPDSILYRVGRGRRRKASRNNFETDDDYLTDSETSDDDDFCPHPHCNPRVHDPSSWHAPHGLPYIPHCLDGSHMHPSMTFGPRLLDAPHPESMLARPGMRSASSDPRVLASKNGGPNIYYSPSPSSNTSSNNNLPSNNAPKPPIEEPWWAIGVSINNRTNPPSPISGQAVLRTFSLAMYNTSKSPPQAPIASDYNFTVFGLRDPRTRAVVAAILEIKSDTSTPERLPPHNITNARLLEVLFLLSWLYSGERDMNGLVQWGFNLWALEAGPGGRPQQSVIAKGSLSLAPSPFPLGGGGGDVE